MEGSFGMKANTSATDITAAVRKSTGATVRREQRCERDDEQQIVLSEERLHVQDCASM